MKRIFTKSLPLFLILSLTCSKLYAWTSESGSGVVSAQEVIVRTSLEATQVLQSDITTNLFGTTFLGGTANSASFDSGGVLTTRNVTSSVDVIRLGNNDFLAWSFANSARDARVGVSADNIYTIGTNTRIQGRTSGDQIALVSIFTTSINTTHVRVSGAATLTSTYATGTCSFTFNNGLLTTASC